MPIVNFSYSISSSEGTVEPSCKSTTSAIKQKFINTAAQNVACGIIGNALLQPLDKREYVQPFVPYLLNNWGNHRLPIQQVYDYPNSDTVARLLRNSKK